MVINRLPLGLGLLRCCDGQEELERGSKERGLNPHVHVADATLLSSLGCNELFALSCNPSSAGNQPAPPVPTHL